MTTHQRLLDGLNDAVRAVIGPDAAVRVMVFKDAYGGRYGEEEIGYEVSLPDAQLGNRTLGGLKLLVSKEGSYLTAHIIDPYTGLKGEKNLHPHVEESGIFCFESGRMIDALANGQYISAISMAISVINTHSPDGHYRPLEGERVCALCGSGSEYDYIDCGGCGDYVCEDCMVTCNRCDESYCHECANMWDEFTTESGTEDFVHVRYATHSVCHNCEMPEFNQACHCCGAVNWEDESLDSCRCGMYFINSHGRGCSMCEKLMCSRCTSNSGVCTSCEYSGDDGVRCVANISPHPTNIMVHPDNSVIHNGESWCRKCYDSPKREIIDLMFQVMGITPTMKETNGLAPEQVLMTAYQDIDVGDDGMEVKLLTLITSQSTRQ